MQDQRITELLRELPREEARPGFTARVLDRLDRIDEAPRAAWQPRLAVAVAALALLVTAGIVGLEQRRDARAAEALRALQELRAEHSELRRELRELSTAPPVVYLGGDEDVDLVMDLRKVQPDGGMQPAAVRYDTF